MSTETTENKESRTTLVGPVRLAYAWLWSPKDNLRGEKQYSAVLLFPKEANEFCSDPDRSINAAKAAIRTAGVEKFGDGVRFGVPLLDGDKEGKWPGFWYMNAKANVDYPPKVVGPDTFPVGREDGWASGDWAKVVVSFYAGEGGGGKNVGCGLRAVQFVEHDEHFGGAASDPTSYFQDETGGASQSPVTAGPGAADEYDPFEDES